jgi:hypothetical protein
MLKGNTVSVLIQLSTMPWRLMWEWKYSSTILDLDTRLRWVISLTLWPLYPPTKCPLLPFGQEVEWGPEQVLTLWGREKFSPFRDSKSGHPASNLCLYRLSYPECFRNYRPFLYDMQEVLCNSAVDTVFCVVRTKELAWRQLALQFICWLFAGQYRSEHGN